MQSSSVVSIVRVCMIPKLAYGFFYSRGQLERSGAGVRCQLPLKSHDLMMATKIFFFPPCILVSDSPKANEK